MPCEFIAGDSNLLPGWGCCECRTYNGLQRDQCKRCGHACCVAKPLPEKFGLCNECGVPLDGIGKFRTADGKLLGHVGHVEEGRHKARRA
jgi:hypothetical protein